MNILVTGASGLVGRAVVSDSTARGERVIAFDHLGLDITDEAKVNAVFDRERPDVAINCAAWTDVDGCELDRQRADDANARGPELLALACRNVGALLITISTDYVFDGEKEGFYSEEDQPNPKSVYGLSKLEGERRAQSAWARTIIVRSGYIFGIGGKNFLSGVVARAQRGESLGVIDDSFGTPTYAGHLGERLYDLARLGVPGTYHVVNSGAGASFADFARWALQRAGLDVGLLHAIHMDSLRRPAPRPRNSRLTSLRTGALGLPPLPSWQDAVCQFVDGESAAAAV